MTLARLTFDDGPGPSTARLLEVLGEHGCRATFFLLGRNIQMRPALAARIAAEGHTLGNHTFSHARPHSISETDLRDEIARTDALIADAYLSADRIPTDGVPIRLPYGAAQNDPRLPVLEALRRPHSGWTGDFDDWADPAPTAGELVQRIGHHINARWQRSEAATLCLHDSSRLGAERPATVEAVCRLLMNPEYRSAFRAGLPVRDRSACSSRG